mmetsp:Transcript_32967/g.97178  ORF Transcript_32967/g.97178 Transcript_32967/m.97178 type:complete len:733 (+) Transcript_32967:38-2236(+)
MLDDEEIDGFCIVQTPIQHRARAGVAHDLPSCQDPPKIVALSGPDVTVGDLTNRNSSNLDLNAAEPVDEPVKASPIANKTVFEANQTIEGVVQATVEQIMKSVVETEARRHMAGAEKKQKVKSLWPWMMALILAGTIRLIVEGAHVSVAKPPKAMIFHSSELVVPSRFHHAPPRAVHAQPSSIVHPSFVQLSTAAIGHNSTKPRPGRGLIHKFLAAPAKILGLRSPARHVSTRACAGAVPRALSERSLLADYYEHNATAAPSVGGKAANQHTAPLRASVSPFGVVRAAASLLAGSSALAVKKANVTVPAQTAATSESAPSMKTAQALVQLHALVQWGRFSSWYAAPRLPAPCNDPPQMTTPPRASEGEFALVPFREFLDFQAQLERETEHKLALERTRVGNLERALIRADDALRASQLRAAQQRARTTGELPSSLAPRRLLAAPPTAAELTIENERRVVKHEREMAALMAKYETVKLEASRLREQMLERDAALLGAHRELRERVAYEREISFSELSRVRTALRATEQALREAEQMRLKAAKAWRREAERNEKLERTVAKMRHHRGTDQVTIKKLKKEVRALSGALRRQKGGGGGHGHGAKRGKHHGKLGKHKMGGGGKNKTKGRVLADAHRGPAHAAAAGRARAHFVPPKPPSPSVPSGASALGKALAKWGGDHFSGGTRTAPPPSPAEAKHGGAAYHSTKRAKEGTKKAGVKAGNKQLGGSLPLWVRPSWM